MFKLSNEFPDGCATTLGNLQDVAVLLTDAGFHSDESKNFLLSLGKISLSNNSASHNCNSESARNNSVCQVLNNLLHGSWRIIANKSMIYIMLVIHVTFGTQVVIIAFHAVPS